MSKIILEMVDGILGIVENNDGVEIEIHDYDWPQEELPQGRDHMVVRNPEGPLVYEGEEEN